MRSPSNFKGSIFASALAFCRRCALLAVVLLQLLVGSALAAEQPIQDHWQGVERIVAIGDAHGDYTNFLAVLRDAELVNRRGNWIGGNTHLVQLGDVPDRGPDSAKIITLLKKLETQAQRDGGMVHVLIGNHEVMNMLGDLRYVDPGEYEAMRTRNSRRVRDDFYEIDIARRQAANPEFVADDSFQEQWEQSIPLGMIEHQFAWSPSGEIGAWVLQHNAVIKIDRTLFVHGGISPDVVGMGIADINAQIRHELNGGLGEEPGLSERETGPLWYRGLAVNDAATELVHLNQVLATYDVDRVVVGHTPGQGTVVPRFDGKVLVADVGLSAYYGGHRASLLLENGQAITIQGGARVPIPATDADLLSYYEAIAELAPDVPALRARIEELRLP